MKKYRSARTAVTSTICTVVERDRLASDAANELAVVRRDEDGRAARVDLAKEVHDFERQIGVEIAGRLIGEDDGRIVHEGARDRDPLLFAARELHRIGAHPVLQAHPLEHLERPALLLRERHPEHARHERDVLEDGLGWSSLKSWNTNPSERR